jgi:hypothetical protein
MLASAISSSVGESERTRTLSISRSSGRYCSTKGRSTRASPCASQGMPATTGGTVANWPEAASRLCKWVVPLRMWPTVLGRRGAARAPSTRTRQA